MSTPPRRRSRRLAPAATAAPSPDTPPPARLLDLPTELARLFRVPGGTLAAAAYCVPPLLICVATVTANTLALRDPAATDATVTLRLAALALVAASAVHLAVRRVAGTAPGSPPEGSEPAGGSEPPARAIL